MGGRTALRQSEGTLKRLGTETEPPTPSGVRKSQRPEQFVSRHNILLGGTSGQTTDACLLVAYWCWYNTYITRHHLLCQGSKRSAFFHVAFFKLLPFRGVPNMKQQIKEMVTQLNSFETHNLYQRKITSFEIVLQIGKADESITLFVKSLTFLHILP